MPRLALLSTSGNLSSTKPGGLTQAYLNRGLHIRLSGEYTRRRKSCDAAAPSPVERNAQERSGYNT